MNKNLRKVLITIGVIAVAVVVCILLNLDGVENFSEKYAGANLSADVAGMERAGTYSGYLNSHADAADSTTDVEVDLLNYTAEEGAETLSDYEGAAQAVYTETGSEVSWTVNVPTSGFYNLYMEYLAPKSHGVAAERGVYINGELPFDAALDISFTRAWTDAGEKKVDNQGNEIRPSQTEVYMWQSSYFRDDRGYTTAPYKFYFEAGENTLTLSAENEPLVIKGLKLAAIEKQQTYAEYLASLPAASANTTVDNYSVTIQGEDSNLRSESSLYAKYDRSSPTTYPNSVTNTVLNYTGGEAWSTNGQWIQWDIEVPADGYYYIMIKGRQNYNRGAVSNRRVLIDGEVPFTELNEVSFDYRNDWECKTLSDNEGTPYKIYLTAGQHTLRLEATLGGMGSILSQLEDSTYRLNQIYRKILVYTGATPDQYRDYRIQNVYPEVIEAMDLESKRLFKLVDDMVAYSGQKADQIATAQTVAQQLERFVAKPNKITVEFTTFKDNITALGTASLNMSSTKLDVDYITVYGANVSPKIEKANFFSKAWHEIKSFFASFFVDYNSVGDVYEGGEAADAITVWVLTGRDQGTILKAMVDDDFTPNSGVKVNVEIVDPGAVLSAVMAGRGPNVVLSMGADQPVNYALRGASVDITQFEGWEDVLANYSESSYEQYRLDGAIYGVPECQTFNVMFYRKDVMEELGLEIPQTWQDLIEMLPTIQGSNLSVGIPSAGGSSSSAAASTTIASNAADLSMYFSLLFQNGGDMYNDAGTKTTVDTEAGIKAFDEYVRYFNDYGIPVYYDFVSRFRSGEMPIGIASYSTYNTLMVSAPEIRGLWDFTLIPGTERTNEDGTTYIDRSDFITGNVTMMLESESEELKQSSWEFMKWWASPDTQIWFGREIEALLGASARYNTANRAAFSSLSWSADDIEVLNEQWDYTRGIREVPGGYYTGRHISNAIRKVINDKDDTRETIIDYSIKIDEEIKKKRTEFGMSVE